MTQQNKNDLFVACMPLIAFLGVGFFIWCIYIWAKISDNRYNKQAAKDGDKE